MSRDNDKIIQVDMTLQSALPPASVFSWVPHWKRPRVTHQSFGEDIAPQLLADIGWQCLAELYLPLGNVV